MRQDTMPLIPLPDLNVKLLQLPISSVIVTFLSSVQQYEYMLIIMLEGVIELLCAEHKTRLQSSQVIFTKKNSFIKSYGNRDARFWMVSFNRHFIINGLYTIHPPVISKMADNGCHRFQIDGDTQKIIKKLLFLLEKNSGPSISPNSATICQLTFNLMCSCLAESEIIKPAAYHGNARKETITVKFLNLVSAKVLTHHDVRYYADSLCMTQGNLTKIIKEVTGITPKTLIEQALINTAKEMLDKSLITIYTLAEELGFKSSSAFINFFRRHSGTTPADYRNRNISGK